MVRTAYLSQCCSVHLRTIWLKNADWSRYSLRTSQGPPPLVKTLDPEDVRALIAQFFAICKEVITTHGGTLEKFIGDAVMAVFGLPQAHGDDGQRALSAALELRDRVKQDPTLRERLPIRMGVNTGEVVAARDPSAGDFLITGDPVNVAARLQQAAEPWTVLCSERTARAAGDAFIFGQPVALVTKGKAKPVKAVSVIGRAARVVRKVPLIGRDTELAHLELVTRQAFTQRRPFLVNLVAPAGTGKTRLLEEFLDRLPSLVPHANVAIAQCLPYGQRLTYWPLRAVLFRIVGIQEDAPPDRIRAAVAAWCHDAGVEQPQRMADMLAATVGAAELEAIDRDALFGAWRTLVEAASRRRPLVLAFEDLHWSSETLLDLVEFVMQPRGDSSVLIIALARPELLDRRPGWGGGRRNYVSLALEPLPDTAVEALVEHLLGRPSSQVVARVVERADGNPFYAGETVRAIMDRVPSLDDETTLSRTLAELPDTVQATVLARLDLLHPAERRVLQLGAVFGRTFRTPGIAAARSHPCRTGHRSGGPPDGARPHPAGRTRTGSRLGTSSSAKSRIKRCRGPSALVFTPSPENGSKHRQPAEKMPWRVDRLPLPGSGDLGLDVAASRDSPDPGASGALAGTGCRHRSGRSCPGRSRETPARRYRACRFHRSP